MATKKKSGASKRKKKSASKVVKMKQPKMDAVSRISHDEAVFRDMIEHHFEIKDVDYQASLYRAMQRFSLTVAELNQAHGFHLLDVISFRLGESKDGS